MGELSTIINVSISRQTTAVARASFDTPMFVGYHTNWAERVRTYDISAGLTGLTDDSFTADDQLYKMVKAFADQNPKVSTVKIGRRDSASTMDVDITPAAQDSSKYIVEINGTEFSFTSGVSATVAQITAGITAAVNAGSEPVTATDNTTYVTLQADVAGTMFDLYVTDEYDGRQWTREDQTTDPGLTTDLNNILTADRNWYLLAIDGQGAAEIAAAATWIESNDRLFVATSGDSEIAAATTGDIASTVSAANRDRTSIWYSSKPHLRLAEAAAGTRMPYDPGATTWAYKTPSGPNSDDLTATEIVNIEGKNANYYRELGGVDVTLQGTVASGEWIDVIRGVDWFTARLQERIYSQLVNLGKIPYTNSGIAIIENEVRGQIEDGIEVGLFTSDTAYVVSVPDARTVSSADKIARTLNNVTFTAYLAGAIHKVNVTGVVTY